MMERVSGLRLNAGAHPHRLLVPVRFADLDTQGHINNIAMASILEDARTRMLLDMGLSLMKPGQPTNMPGGGRLVTVAAHCEYLAEAFYPGEIEAYGALLAIGKSSFTLTQLGVQNGKPVVACQAVLALIDDNGPRPLNDSSRRILSAFALAETIFPARLPSSQ